MACGNGNAALAAARRFCEATGLDYVPALLEQGRKRAAAEGLEVTFHEGDTNVYMLSDGPVVTGASSKLTRNDSGVSTTIHTSKLPAGHAVTVWWVVFNHPEHCTHGSGAAHCGPGDLLLLGGDPAVEGTVLYAAGHVIGGSGVGNYGAHLSVGDTSGVLLGAGPGLTNPRGAEIHLVVRSHGPAIPRLVAEQISTFGAGCNNVPPGTGTPGPNTCGTCNLRCMSRKGI